MSSIKKCPECGKETNNPKFCSRSCAATHTNKISPKRKLQRKCTRCNEHVVRNKRSTLCTSCFETKKEVSIIGKTLGEYRNRESMKGKHQSWLHNSIRAMNNHHNRKLKELSCQFCGYSNHVELCHIQPVSRFPDETLVTEVNNPGNILVLCPNHHWEFDNGILSRDDIPERE